jgi:hypothetical protein
MKKYSGRASQKAQVSRTEMIPHPPPISEYNVKHATVLRFTASSAQSLNVTFQNLLDLVLLQTTAVAAFDLFYAVKIRRVDIWAIPVLGGATSVELIYNGVVAGFVGDQKIHQDTSMGVQPAHVSAKPGRSSLAADFQVSSATNAFRLIVPAGAVIDVHLSYLSRFGPATAAQNASAGATVGSLTLRGLDGLAAAATQLPNAVADNPA